jgi:hypothetical protein
MVDIRKYDRPRDGQPGWDEQVTLPDDSGDELIHLTRESFNALFADYNRAMLTISTELAAEAIRREWCTEFEDFVRHLNTKLPDPIVVTRDVPVKISLVLSFRTTLPNVRLEGDLEAAFYDLMANRDVSLYDEAHSTVKRLIGDADRFGIEVEAREV